MPKPWWAPVIQWTLWGIFMSIFTGWMKRSRMKQRPKAEADTLKHPKSTLLIALAGFLLFAGLAIASNTIGKNDTTTVWTTFIFLFFVLMSLFMVLEFVRARHHLSKDGLDYGKLFSKRGYLRWTEVRSVKYAPSMKWFKLRTEAGATVRISAMLMGLPRFAEHVLAHVSPESIDEPTKTLLHKTADGHPPDI